MNHIFQSKSSINIRQFKYIIIVTAFMLMKNTTWAQHQCISQCYVVPNDVTTINTEPPCAENETAITAGIDAQKNIGSATYCLEIKPQRVQILMVPPVLCPAMVVIAVQLLKSFTSYYKKQLQYRVMQCCYFQGNNSQIMVLHFLAHYVQHLHAHLASL